MVPPWHLPTSYEYYRPGSSLQFSRYLRISEVERTKTGREWWQPCSGELRGKCEFLKWLNVTIINELIVKVCWDACGCIHMVVFIFIYFYFTLLAKSNNAWADGARELHCHMISWFWMDRVHLYLNSTAYINIKLCARTHERAEVLLSLLFKCICENIYILFVCVCCPPTPLLL